jgi:hypothetical protein
MSGNDGYMILVQTGLDELIYNNNNCKIGINHAGGGQGINKGFYYSTNLSETLIDELFKHIIQPVGNYHYIFFKIRPQSNINQIASSLYIVDIIELLEPLNGELKFNDGIYNFVNGYLHNNIEPAVKLNNGTLKWYYLSNLHRNNNEPAIIRANGINEYYVKGLRHRENGPAFKSSLGKELWYTNGILHNTNGPAIITHGYKEWYLNGTLILHENQN